MMRILLCIPALGAGKGGAERVAAELGFAMKDRGHEVSYAYKVSSLGSRRIPQYPVPETSRLLTWDNTLQGKLTFRNNVRALHPDLILVFYATWQVVEVYSLLHDLNIPVCFQECSNPKRILTDNWVKASNASQMRYEILKESVGIRVTQEQYVNSFADDLKPYVHSFPNAFARCKNNAYDNLINKTILHVGGAKPNKQVSFMVDAFEKICNQFPDWKLVLCTTMPMHRTGDYEKLVEKIHSKFAPGRIILKENVEDMASIYDHTGIHCITSLSEGLPNCVCEAMCHGIPSVGYEDSIGTNLLIKHGINGFLAPASPRVESLAATLASLMVNDGLRRELGAKAWKEAAAFNPDSVYDAWEIFFESSLSRAAAQKSKKETLISTLFPKYDEISECSWRDYVISRIDSLTGNDVIFFGCGGIYNDFKNLFSKVKPHCVIVDRSDSITSVDGIAVVDLNSFHGELRNYPIIIFSECADIIAHRLQLKYGPNLDILCIDRKMYQVENNTSNNILQQDEIRSRLKKIDSGKRTYPVKQIIDISCVNDELPNCAFCGENRFIPYLSSNNVNWYGGETFQLLRCANCNLVCASPRPHESYIINNIKANGEKHFNRKLNRNNVQSIHDNIARNLFLLVPHATTAFDVGFGAGTMLNAYNKLGLTAEGNEVNSYACNMLTSQGFIVYNLPTINLHMDNKYDIITALDYIEHSYTPFDDLLKINCMLNTNGILYLKTLYLGSEEHIIQGEKWKLFGTEHFYYYFIDTLKEMVTRAGFIITDLKIAQLVHIIAKKTSKKYNYM